MNKRTKRFYQAKINFDYFYNEEYHNLLYRSFIQPINEQLTHHPLANLLDFRFKTDPYYSENSSQFDCDYYSFTFSNMDRE